MLIGTCKGHDVMYYRGMLWVRETGIVYFRVGTMREAIIRAKRNIKGFVAA